MRSVQPGAPTKGAPTPLWIAVTALGMALCYAPWWPSIPLSGLESGWALGLAVGCERDLVFGRDLVFTYGPLGCWVTWQYSPSTYVASLVFWCVLAALSAALVLTVPLPWRYRLIALVAFGWLAVAPDSALLALPTAYVFNAYLTRRTSIWSGVSLLALGVITLTKFTLMPVSILAMATGVLLRQRQLRAAAVEPIIFLVGTLLGWTLLGQQPLSSLTAWLVGAGEVARGYPQAMANPAGWDGFALDSLKWSVSLALAALGVACVAAIRPFAPGETWIARLAWIAFIAAVLLVSVRLATVRGDLWHLLPGFSFVGALALVTLALSVRWGPRLAVGVIAFYCAAIALSALGMRWMIEPRALGMVRGVTALIKGQLPPADLERALDAWKKTLPPPPRILQEDGATFDILGHDQYLLGSFPRDRWRPRPVLQSYSAYTPDLAARNAAALTSANGPRFLLVRSQTIDGRWPTQDDAGVWPILRTHYRVTDRLDSHLLLERREEPVQQTPVHEEGAIVEADDWIDVPSERLQGLYVRIVVRQSWVDRVRAFVWKPPLRELEIAFSGSQEAQPFRLVPEIAAAGFLLNPDLRTLADLEAWVSGSWPEAPMAVRIRVVDERGRPLRAHYQLRTSPFLVP